MMARTSGSPSSTLIGASFGSSKPVWDAKALSRSNSLIVAATSAATTSAVVGSLSSSATICLRVSLSSIQRSTSRPRSNSSGAVSNACCPIDLRYSLTVSVGSSPSSRSYALRRSIEPSLAFWRPLGRISDHSSPVSSC